MSFWWNYKTRASPHREFLYQEQIKAYVDLSANIPRLLHPCLTFLSTKDLTPENRKEFEEIVFKAAGELRGQVRLSMMILPLDVAKAVNQLFETLFKLDESDSSERGIEVLIKAEMGVYEAVREWAGVEPLTKDMLRAFGQHRSMPANSRL
jgi:hypothetical protein